MQHSSVRLKVATPYALGGTKNEGSMLLDSQKLGIQVIRIKF